MARIECKNVSLSYDGKIVLHDLSFSVGEGDYLCIVGENGSGKSTLAKALVSLKSPHEGRIEYHDGLTHREIGYLGQMREMQKDFPASVFEVVLSGCLNSRGMRPFYNASERALAALNMEKLVISDLKKRSYRDLSGGQQQRVLLARALCAAKKMIVLDEPVSGLDAAATKEFYSVIKDINEKGTTVVMVSHDIKSALEYSSHILHLENRPLFFGKTEDYIKSGLAARFVGGDPNVL